MQQAGNSRPNSPEFHKVVQWHFSGEDGNL